MMANAVEDTAAAAGMDDDVDVEWLRASYEAFVQRRLQRGALSIRTRQGYERLREKFQQRLRFVQDANDDITEAQAAVVGQQQGTASVPVLVEAQVEAKATYEWYSDEEEDEEEVAPPPIAVANEPVGEPQEASQEIESIHSEPDTEASALRQLIGVFFDPRVKRLVLETLWPLAHRGRSHEDPSSTGDHSDAPSSTGKKTQRASTALPLVPEWQELEQHKYYAFMFQTLLWLFPGLPAFEAQELAERDWAKDCEFDAYGSYGLSFEGFMVSLLDLALACTDGSVDKCVEFLAHMTTQLETSLPVFRVPTMAVLPTPNEGDGEDTQDPRRNPYEQILWRPVRLLQLFPCPVNARAQYLELKTKLSTAPVVLMVLASNERPMELQLSTSAKLLVRERDHRSSVRRNTMHSGALAHFIEIERQFLWTFRSFPTRPTLLIVPSALVSKRTLTLYACCRALESHEHSLQASAEQTTGVDPLLTLFTAVPEPFPLLYGAENSLCGRIDRHSSKLLVVDHRGRSSKQFKIIFKTSLIHNTGAAGGAGAAAIVASLANVDSVGTANCTSELVGGNNQSAAQAIAHSFIFIVKMTSDVLANGPQKRRASTVGAGKGTTTSTDASVPAQWFTTFCGANENKTIFVDTDADGDSTATAEDSTSGVYYVYVFTLHGFYFEAIYEDSDPTTDPSALTNDNEVRADSPMSILTNTGKRDRVPGSVLLAPSEDQAELAEDLMMQVGGSSNDKKAALNHVTNSATLLRQLLLLRKKRQVCTQPPPECIGGSKITSMKSVTAAAGLRAKFLKARAVERRSRFLENEEALRMKVLAKLLKAEAKKRALRGDVDPFEQSPETNQATEPARVDPDMSAKATLLANFFKEMAVYHPTQKELDEAQDDEHGRDADELMEHFGDLFDDDHALHNMLDAEKWLTNEAKTVRRKSMMEERVIKRRQSLIELGKQQVPEFDDHVGSPERSGKDEGKTQERKKSTVQSRASEDYFSTAMLIRDLMREVADEEEQLLKEKTQETTAEAARVESLATSLAFASCRCADHGFDQNGVAENNSHEPTPLEDSRREDWLTSHHVHDLGANAMLEKRHATLRPSLIPSSQHFDSQASQLPWQPVWEVRDATTATATDEGNQHDAKEPRASPQRRPMTATGATFSPRPPLNQPDNPLISSAAAQSANLLRLNTRRIRSARAGSILRQPITPQDKATARPLTTSDPSSAGEGRRTVSHVPQAFLVHLLGVDGSSSADKLASAEDCDTNRQCDSQSSCVASTHPSPVAGLTSEDLVDVIAKVDDTAQPVSTAKPTTKPKRLKKKKTKLSREEKRFAQRVQELLSISPFGNTGGRPLHG